MSLIEFTPEAIEAIKGYHSNLQIPPDHFLRIGIRQKNAQDKGLLIGFDTKTDKDKETEVEGIKIIYHPAQSLFFAGMKIHYTEREGRKGFVIIESKKN